MADDPKKPYGDVTYADPGYKEDGKKRYPIDTEDHAKAALSYFSMPKNHAGYSAEEVKAIMGRIKAACRKFGIEVSDDKEHRGLSEILTPDEVRALEEGKGPMQPLGVETRSSGVAIDDVRFGEGIITVVAVPYEQMTQVSFAGGVWNEVFSRTAFDNFDPTKRRVPVVSSLIVPNPNHEKGHLVGRIIETRSSEVGLVTDVKISRTAVGTETLELANDRSLSASVGFWIKDPRRDQELNRETRTRRIHRAFLDHLAFVATPAYVGAEILSVRSEPNLPVIDTPYIDEFQNDPIFKWANEQIKK